jgi:galactose-1-phosphate uridylyltransferase
MNFEIVRKETVVLNPRKNMEPRAIPSEIRFDPLTGRTARICHFMKLSWPSPDFEALVGDTAATCPFCPERILDLTPSFPPDVLTEGRMSDGDRLLFPNIAPYDGISAVATMSSRHFIPPAELTPDLIAAGLKLAQAFFRRVHETGHPESIYHLVNWNYMPPSGSSLIHPHLQVFASSQAPNLMRAENAAAADYHRQHKRNYWDDLTAHEIEAKERYLGRIGRTHWMTAFAPMGVAGDVLAVVDGAANTLDLTDADLGDLAAGLSRLIAAYEQMGVYSFNMNYFTGANQDESTRFHILFSPRTFFNAALGTPDIGALRNLYNETICMAFPEEIADTLRPALG